MTRLDEPVIQTAFEMACAEAERFRGATAPNPPVGAAALDGSGRILGVAAHQKAGTAHAEARLLADLAQAGALDEIHTVVVTLEPCNHTGRTPPCSRALAELKNLKRVIFGVSDPNPQAQGGAEFLRSHGIEAICLDFPANRRALELTKPFFRWVKTGRPWVTVKTAWRKQGDSLTMIPPSGSKTFTSPRALRFAHELRKRSDAILTGSGTVLSDTPGFTVRHVEDHPDKRRWLAVMDRRGRVPEDWLKQKRLDGFELLPPEKLASVPAVFEYLGQQGVLEVLVEAGPSLSQFILSEGLWNEHFRIQVSDGPERIENEIRAHSDLFSDQIYVHRNH